MERLDFCVYCYHELITPDSIRLFFDFLSCYASLMMYLVLSSEVNIKDAGYAERYPYDCDSRIPGATCIPDLSFLLIDTSEFCPCPV